MGPAILWLAQAILQCLLCTVACIQAEEGLRIIYWSKRATHVSPWTAGPWNMQLSIRSRLMAVSSVPVLEAYLVISSGFSSPGAELHIGNIVGWGVNSGNALRFPCLFCCRVLPRKRRFATRTFWSLRADRCFFFFSFSLLRVPTSKCSYHKVQNLIFWRAASDSCGPSQVYALSLYIYMTRNC